MGLVGESGAGKSTLARALLRLLQPAHGSVELSGLDLLKSPPAVMRAQRRNLQMVFQDPLASLNPRMTVGAGDRRTTADIRARIECVRAARKGRDDFAARGPGCRHGGPLPT